MDLLYCISVICFLVSSFVILWAMVGYELSLRLIDKLPNLKAKNRDDIQEVYRPTVTVMIVAHNEENVILKKLINVTDNDYPEDKITYLVASDKSDDLTVDIVSEYISKHPEISIKLYQTKEHKGKTNAQNEAQKIVDSEILVMTDANAMFKRNSISQLVKYFSDSNVAYVTGALKYINDDNRTASSEITYWDQELVTRLIESDFGNITAGNGAIYACRNVDYVDVPPIECHDSSFPYIFGINGKRALFNPNSIAYEKAGETDKDEFRRKVRMNRNILFNIKRGIYVLNPIKYGWFSYFYFGHRTARYLLWICHLSLIISNLILAVMGGWIWRIIFLLQLVVYFLALAGKYSNLKVLKMLYYYVMTVVAQWCGVINCLKGKSKPTWEVAKTTR